MPKGLGGIVIGYAKMWPREIFDKKVGSKLLANKLEFLKEPGVYILYRDEHPHYIGKTGQSLFHRLKVHAINPRQRYYQFWNLFSAFAVRDKLKRDELEAILIAAMPTVNSSKPKLNKMKLPREVSELVKQLRHSKVSFAIFESSRKANKFEAD
jgi:hypothetical protein